MFNFFKTSKTFVNTVCRSYAVKRGGMGRGGKGVAAVSKKKELDCETDSKKLVQFCCINYKLDQEPIPLKSDSEYPDWLWTLRTCREAPPITELDPNTYNYWRRVRRWNTRRWNRLAQIHGWHKREHRQDHDILPTFYGDWHIRLKQWEEKRNVASLDKGATSLKTSV